MPQVGYDIDAGRIVQWLVKEGDTVEKGQIVAVVESEKANFEVEAPEGGTLLKMLYEADVEARVLEPMAWVGAPGEQIPEAPVSRPAPAAAAAAAAPGPGMPAGPAVVAAPAVHAAPLPQVVVAEPPTATRRFASPVARRIARQEGIDIAAIPGSGPGGRVVARDVLTFAGLQTKPYASAPTPEATSQDRVVPFDRMRQRIADRLSHAKQSIPHFYLLADADMTRALAWRKRFNERQSVHVTINDMIIKAVALALREFPAMNAHVQPDRMVLKKRVNIGVAVSVDNGLLVPVIADADWKELTEIAQAARTIRQDAQRGVVDTRDVGTFTISNLGRLGVTQFVPIVNPPECAILGVASIQKRVVPIESGIGVHDMLSLTLAADHRAVDGAYAGQFLAAIKRHLEGYTDTP
jgi:pyruvate dehydrogenase E2 component (dihydrolipoamide acetyltransferase)